MITVILLDYLRHEHTERVKDVNLKNAGHPFELVTVDIKGVSKAINYGIGLSEGDVVTMANDILMPDNWLFNFVRYRTQIPNSAMIGIHTVEGLPAPSEVNGLKIWPCCPFGNVLITREAIDKVGYFNVDLDPYSVNDRDYWLRCELAGMLSYYIPGTAEHIGHDVGQQTDYRLMKDKSLNDKWRKGEWWYNYYKTTGNIYLGYKQD
jgi:GT2 family glycosyltransferase